jgi:hypothetical protein
LKDPERPRGCRGHRETQCSQTSVCCLESGAANSLDVPYSEQADGCANHNFLKAGDCRARQAGFVYCADELGGLARIIAAARG